MTLQKQITFWVVSFLVLILVLWLLSPILLPFIAGLVLAYFLDPVADALERLGLPRLMATTVILLLSILLLVLIGLLVVPILGDQIVKFAGDLPSLMQSLLARFNDVAPQWMKDAITKSGADIQGSVSDIAGKAAGWTATLLGLRLVRRHGPRQYPLAPRRNADRGLLSSGRLGPAGCQSG